MRIAEVCPRYRPYIGGVETHVEEISKRLARMGHDVTVLSTDPSGKLPKSEIIDGVRVLRFAAFAPGDAYYFSTGLRSYMKKVDGYDVVHAHGYHAFPAYYAASAKTPRLIFTPHYHGHGHTPLRNLLLKPYAYLGRRIFERASRVICVSSYEKGLVDRDFRCGDKAVVIPNGVNKEEFKGLEPYPKGLKVILYVGRLEEYKGVQYAIRALPYLPWHRLHIIGKGPYKESLIKEALAIGVKDRVAFMEDQSREDLLRWYATADVFVMLSRFEAYGITVAEALTAGVPCIVAKGSALDEFIGESCKGVDLPIEGEKLAEIIQNARFRGMPRNVLDWDEVTERVISVYEGRQ
ncbi:glycosyltransferase family 4 protein [Methanocella conradii]|uniref:glycosyltransferase family 4 protein n=1 Tax=Methanocella conradii TaxID=1175444 RepID=UPI00157DBF0F|nr:glycosyltransferase family 4 protein [Methanocella conradii]